MSRLTVPSFRGTSYRAYFMLSTILFRFMCRGALKSPRRHRIGG
ncbi:hypothetical protein CPL00370_CDS0007 [Klebsiella phage ViciousJeremy]